MDVELKPIAADTELSLAEAVYETLLEAIVSGRLRSEVTLSEVALAKQLEVSRTPVHDALRQLAKDGLVEQETGRRARVAHFSRDDIYEIFEIRKYLEGPAAELAAARMDARQFAPLRTAANELQASHGQPDWILQWAQLDETFHSTIAASSGNRRLAQDIGRYHLLHRGFNKMSTDVESLRTALAEHVEILNSLEQHDGAAAREAMIKHITHWQEYFIQHFPR
jgi:DNA-binding GntR family transcriptional regulator